MESSLIEPALLSTWSEQAQEEAEDLESEELLERQFESLASQLGLRKATKMLHALRLEESSDSEVSRSSFRSSSGDGFTEDSDRDQRRVDHLISQMRTMEAILSVNSDGLDRLASILGENNHLLERLLTQMSTSTAAMKNGTKLLERLISQKNETSLDEIAPEIPQE